MPSARAAAQERRRDDRRGDRSRPASLAAGRCVSRRCCAASRRRRRRDWPSERPPRPLPARDVKFPPYEIQTLPNGLQVVAVLHHEQPAVSMRLLVRAGSALGSARASSGSRDLAASLLDQGTTTQVGAAR